MEAITIEAISLPESQRLIELETVIKRGFASFIEVGDALTEIRDSRLYRIEHGTFEDYCVDKWGMKRRNAYDLMNTAAVAKDVQSIAQIDRPTARELAKVPAVERPKVLRSVMRDAGGERITHKQLQEACDKSNASRLPHEDESTPRAAVAPSNGLRYSQMAIEQMEKIDPKDSLRGAAFDEVSAWLARIGIATKKPSTSEQENQAPEGEYSWAIGYADNAIAQLRKIQSDDINRIAALDKVAAWIALQKKPPTAKKGKPYPLRPPDSSAFVAMAMLQLERILPTDTGRIAALIRMREYVDNQLNRKAKP